MSCFACLRIELPDDPASEHHHPVFGVVQKITEAYLETRWLWPRRFTPLSDHAFVLVDPRVTELQIDELRRLADELQHHLFGAGGQGEVSLLLFEGSTESVVAFARMQHAEIASLLAAPGKLPFGGRLVRIRPGEHSAVEHPLASLRHLRRPQLWAPPRPGAPLLRRRSPPPEARR